MVDCIFYLILLMFLCQIQRATSNIGLSAYATIQNDHGLDRVCPFLNSTFRDRGSVSHLKWGEKCGEIHFSCVFL